MSRAEAKRTAVNAAMTVAEDVANGGLDPAALDAAVVGECQALAFQVLGPDDLLWPLQVQVMRDVLAVGAGSVILSAELSEWAAVAAQAEGPPPRAESFIERALAAGADEDGDDDG